MLPGGHLMARSPSNPCRPRRVVVVSVEVVVVDRPRRGVNSRKESLDVRCRMHVRENVDVVRHGLNFGNKGRQWFIGRVTALSTISPMRP